MTVKICAVAIALAASALIMRELGFRGAPVFAAICFVFILSLAAESAISVGEENTALSLIANAEEELGAVFKIVGVGYLCGISSDICTELGEKGIAKAVSVAGRVEIFLISLPFLGRLMSLAAELVQ